MWNDVETRRKRLKAQGEMVEDRRQRAAVLTRHLWSRRTVGPVTAAAKSKNPPPFSKGDFKAPTVKDKS